MSLVHSPLPSWFVPSTSLTEPSPRRLPIDFLTFEITLPLRLGIREPMGLYCEWELIRLHAFANEKASNRSLCAGSTGLRYFGCGIFSPGL